MSPKHEGRPGKAPNEQPAQQLGSDAISAGDRLTAAQLLETPAALLTRAHLAELGLGRRAVDAVFRELPTVVLPGYSRPMVRAGDYLELVERSTYTGDRVRP